MKLLRKVAALRQPMDTFFDKVMVMVDDERVRNRSILMLFELLLSVSEPSPTSARSSRKVSRGFRGTRSLKLQSFRFVSGHVFSRAVRSSLKIWALAPANLLTGAKAPTLDVSGRHDSSRALVQSLTDDIRKWALIEMNCHHERSEESAFCRVATEKQIPRAKCGRS